MSNMKKVYSPDGEMVEVNNLNAHDLVTHNGWTFKNPNKSKDVVEDNNDDEGKVDQAVEDAKAAEEAEAKKKVAAEKRKAAAQAKKKAIEDAKKTKDEGDDE